MCHDGSPENREVLRAGRHDEFDAIVEGEGRMDRTDAVIHLAERTPRREVSDVGLRGDVVEPDIGPEGQVGGVEGPDDGEGVRDSGVTLDHAVQGTGVVDEVDDILLVERSALE